MYKEILDNLITRYPALTVCRNDILGAFKVLKTSFQDGGKLLIAGNGGSAADCEHISGELMKSFVNKRAIKPEAAKIFAGLYGNDGNILADKLERALPAISLPSMISIYTAVSNDSDPLVAFAQMVYALGRKDDVFLAISTSGNAKNIVNAVMTANAIGMKTIALTGLSGGKIGSLCDVSINAPNNESSAIIQEYHLPIYHTLCAMLQDELLQ
jgi:D-sedoheptulose 7-phosphate isomerase